MPTTWTNRHGIPDALVRAIVSRHKRSLGRLSVTQLIEPPRIRRLLEQCDVERDVSEQLWALLGSGVHAVLDDGSNEAEVEIAARVNGPGIQGDGCWISGTFDRIETEHGVIIRDWKVTSVSTWKAGGRDEWTRQLNCYAWLLRNATLRRVDVSTLDPHVPQEPTALLVTMIFRDWNGARAEAAIKAGDDSYPHAAAQTIEIPLFSNEVSDAYIRERVAIHLSANDVRMPNLPPMCTDEERWHRPPVFAVMREKRKRALRLFDRRDEAVAFAELQNVGGLRIDERPGVDARCLSYCPARTVCPHGIAVDAAMSPAAESEAEA